MVKDLIRSARRRFLLNEALAQSALALTITLGGFALLLILGTALLGMWSLAVFAGVGIGLAIHRLRQRTPDEYLTAVRVDRSQQLHDALSTAVYFSQQPGKAGAYREPQLTQAEDAARSVAVENAAPFTFPRAAYALAALLLLSGGLTGLRYRSGRLNLRAPLTSLFSEDTQANAKKKAAGDKGDQWLQEAQTLLSKLDGGSDPNGSIPHDADDVQDAMNRVLSDQQGNRTQQKGADGKENGPDQNAGADPLDGNGSQQLNENQSDNLADLKIEQSDGSKVSSKGSNSKNSASLMSMLKDAITSLMSQSKDGSPEDNEKNSQLQDSQKDSLSADQMSTSKSAAMKDAAQSAAQDNDPNSQQGRDDSAKGKLDSKNASKPGEAGSGVGSQEGSKEIKQAELLKAMGKISELIGKRAADVSGETTIEVQSGSQQLRTAYSNTQASHGETDGDVTRDQIPVSLQAYVQQYFAQVRKSANAAKANPGKDGGAKPADASQPQN